MTQDTQKQAVAQAAMDLVLPQLTETSVLGIGTGSTANKFIDLLAEHRDRFRGAVASSSESERRLQAHGIATLDLNDITSLTYYIDGADECNPELAMIKGGGAALTREKIVAAVAETFVCIADASKWVSNLGRFPLPVEVIPMARAQVARALQGLGGRPVWREGVITDNGGHILDVHDLTIAQPEQLESDINQIVGVICSGLFAQRRADVLLLGGPEGVKHIARA